MNKGLGGEPVVKRLLVILVTCLISLTAQAQSPNAAIEEAAQLLDQAIEGRLDELAEDKEALYALIDELLLPRFDQRYAAQLVLSRHWRTASEEDRERFIDAFIIT